MSTQSTPDPRSAARAGRHAGAVRRGEGEGARAAQREYPEYPRKSTRSALLSTQYSEYPRCAKPKTLSLNRPEETLINLSDRR